MAVLEHEHPLNLIDLQPNFPLCEEGDDDDDDDNLVTRKNFCCPRCDRCDEEISWFHRYYYKCAHSCEYSLHKLCGELPLTLKHTSHLDHTLTLLRTSHYWQYCSLCKYWKPALLLYYRCSECNYTLDVNCAMPSNEDRVIYHPSHIHPLVRILKQLLCECNACGKEHKGIFYICSTCSSFSIHNDCAFLPKTLIIQDATDDNFSHSHPLILSYSFTYRVGDSHPRCRACNGYFGNGKLWIFKCEKCRYYAHLDCATSREEPFMSIISSFGNRKFKKDFEDSDYPDLMHLPFPDDSCSTLKHLFFKKVGHETCATDEEYTFHQHPLILVHTESIDNIMPTSSNKKLAYCHNPMKKIELLCNGCLRPVTSVPFFKCANEDENCNFVLHEWCTRIPHELQNYQDHPQHTLILHPGVPRKFFSVFICRVCQLSCNGFVYSCVLCDYHIDVKCGYIPEKITHEAHPGHLLSRVTTTVHKDNLSRVTTPVQKETCRICRGDNLPGYFSFLNSYLSIGDHDLDWVSSATSCNLDRFSFLCHTCNVNIDVSCALLLPREIRHKYDKHPMNLSYLPIENHKSEYFCEICERRSDPESCFYHCNHCVQTIHTHCSPVILQSERATSFDGRGIYPFVNIKFGGTHNVKDHPHPLSFTPGILSDGRCAKCHHTLKEQMIFKCEPCKYAIHFWDCEKLSRLNAIHFWDCEKLSK